MKPYFVFRISYFVAIVLMIGAVSAASPVALYDNGFGLKSGGAIVSSATITIDIYDSMEGGDLIYTETFIGGVSGGKWNLLVGGNPANPLYLDYGKAYYRDYLINGADLSFSGFNGVIVPRQIFYSPLGTVPGSGVFVGKTNSSYTGDLTYDYSETENVTSIVEVVVGSATINETFFNSTSGLNETREVIVNITENQTVSSQVTSNLSTSGYDAANRICNDNFIGSHLCHQSEIVGSIAALDISTIDDWELAGWIISGGPKYPASAAANDCNGFTYGSAGGFLGSFWTFKKPSGGVGGMGNCDSSIPLVCCR